MSELQTTVNHTPVKDEWCLFWNNIPNSEWSGVPVLAQFESSVKQLFLVKQFDRIVFEHCAKYTGDIPKHLLNKE